jgi:hypothetical protein
MIVWVLALVLLASLAGIGYRQGAIRVAFSFFGILVGALLAVPLGGLAARFLGLFGLKDPLLLWALGPVLVFVLVSIAFKVAAAPVHHKVDVYYKYHGGDLRLALWERLHRRLGLCLGLVNGTLYLILLSFVIYVPGYLTVQVATSDRDPRWMRILNSLAHGLHQTGLDKVARSIDRNPQSNYDMADFAAMLYLNPLAEARIRNYPAFLALSELPEFQTLGDDTVFTQAWQAQEPVMSLLDQPSLVAIRSNPQLLKLIWSTTEPNLPDLRTFLDSGRSPQYDPIKILGRWKFDVNAAVSAMRRAKPTMPSSEMLRIRRAMEANLSKTGLVAKPDKQVTFKNAPTLGSATPPTSGQQTLQGQWKDLDTKYLLSFSGVDLNATVEGDRLTIKSPSMDLIFDRED